MKRRMSTSISTKTEPKRQRLFTHCFLPMILLLSAAFFIGSAFIITDYKEKILGWGSVMVLQYSRSKMCETQCRAYGSEALPRGIISETSDLEMRPLWGAQNKKKPKLSMNLLAIAVGIKQKENVNKMVKKFLESDFVVMLFHYDGIVDQWKDLEWNDRAIHVSAVNQTKWWFAKRFLHPDIVSEYGYIFLWDEDLGVDHFNAKRYLSIIKKEGLEISQPALDPEKSELHHPITARDKNSTVHRRTYKVIGRTKCNENNTGPPCTGFVEMMAPVFSRASWRCSWHMIQSDLVFGWGLDFQLGYCAQGDRTQKIGIVDSEYLIHDALPTLGGSAENKVSSPSSESGGRSEVKKQSYIELEIFKSRWKRAVNQDNCWSDPFEQSTKKQK
ncbi:uncharacterized protein LOC105803358 [Gossypium raimondii]|uniref:DUF707 domain-containing protein n=2 Tax=Gossypium raimondii TaxID=29730 RepID=A0A0D2SL23_GOSRA|nr:uncharacterized protein LOC105803358 [Gossypium raimondii]KJB42626.1 hypothetical protein B456_007G161000 [Gossypium raimondii]KJB42627.1 hypothetical protein B456_007G161000 [Gossypium raimondii]